MKNVIYLASYPKSGNTWMRTIISSLLSPNELNINKLRSEVSNSIFSSTEFLNHVGVETYSLNVTQLLSLHSQAFRFHCEGLKTINYIKIHDLFNPTIIPTDVARGVIYVVRNPLDVVPSVANHMGLTIQQAIDLVVCNENSIISPFNARKFNRQLPQRLSTWQNHVSSWVETTQIPTLLIRYEDLLANTLQEIVRMNEFFNLGFSDAQMQKATDATKFSNLSRQEKREGFSDRTRKSESFFQKGKANRWREELTSKQVEEVINGNQIWMEKLGYVVK